MSDILNKKELSQLNGPNVNPQEWTAIIPAAGKGSRLKSIAPKILHPILGKPMLAWLMDLLKPLCQNFVFVVSPEGKSDIEGVLSRHLPIERYTLVTQKYPKGTADAILKTKDDVHTEQCLIIWGDQIGLLPTTLTRCMQVHSGQPQYGLTFPTIFKNNPYIHFVRDKNEKIVSVQQTRQQKLENTSRGENDFGLFMFRTQNLFKVLEHEEKKILLKHHSDQEFDLLQTIPSFDNENQKVLTLRVGSEEETLGINSIEEAKKMEAILKNRQNNAQ